MSDYCPHCMEPLDADGACSSCAPDAPLSQPAHCLPTGTVLAERYLVGRILGQGGFGITYIGRDLMLDMRVAIKEYYPTPYATRNTHASNTLEDASGKAGERIREGKRRFLDEARALAKFHGSPGIVDVRDFFEQNNTAYIVMDYLDGVTLKEHLRDETLDADTAFSLVRPILDSLERIHAEHVIHRDISPDNIMLLSNGALCLMDFGAAHVMDYTDQGTVSMVLKSGYAPEEQYRAKGELGPWTDIYALCATMYRAITGVAPDESLQRLLGDEMAWPSDMGIAILPEQELVLKRGMAPLHRDRYQSIAQMKADIDRIPRRGLGGAADGDGGDGGAGVGDVGGARVGDAGVGAGGARGARNAQPASMKAEARKGGDSARRRKRIGIAAICVSVAIIAAIICGIYFFAPAFSVSFDVNGGSAIQSQTISRAGTVQEPPDPERAGYEFAGWYRDAELATRAEFPLAVDSDTTLYAAWDKTEASYSVECIDRATGERIGNPIVRSDAAIGSTVTEQAPEIDGYELASEAEETLNIGEDESTNTITFSYNKLVGYSVTYLDQATENEIQQAKNIEGIAEGTEVTEEAPEIAGYTLTSDTAQTITLGGNTADNRIVFYYNAAAPAVPAYVDYSAYGSSAASGDTSNSGGSQASEQPASNDVEWAN